MTILVVGLIVFLATHSVRIVAEDWRRAQIARFGLWPWKAMYSIIAITGVVLIVWGYGATRAHPELWHPPVWLRHGTSLLMLLAFVLLAAGYVPRNRIKAAIGHPMVAGVKLWALAHLLANGRISDIVLFGAFLMWAVFDFRAARARDRASGRRYPAGTWFGDIATLVVAAAAWFVFVRFLHILLIGVPVVT